MTRVASLLSLSLLLACGSPRTERRAPASPAPAPATPHPTTAAAPEAEPIARARVDALLTRWLAAQNEGRFDDYAALYATRFDGVRRTRDEVRRFDRARWLEDRRRMFTRPMHVETSDVVVRATASTASVEFTQRWSSGAFSDEGPKRLVLVVESDALRISNEEMLASRPLGGLEASIAAGTFTVFDTPSAALVVLGRADASAARGAPRLVETETTHVALREVSDVVPAAAKALVGTPVQLVGRDGACASEITSLGVAAFVVPHFGDVARWEGRGEGDDLGEGEHAPRTPLAPARVAQEVASLASNTWLVALARRCGPSVAAVRGTRAPSVLPRAAASDAERQEVLRALHAPALFGVLADMVREGVAFEREGDATGIDDATVESALGARLEVAVYARGDRKVYVARMTAEGECGGRVLAYVFERTGTRLVLRDVDYDSVAVVMDVEDDGTLELVGATSLETFRGVVRLGEPVRPISTMSVDFLDCGC